MSRGRSAGIAIAVGLGLAFAAARISLQAAPPLYDGVPVTEPYVWLDPPLGHPGNPSSNQATLAVKGGISPLVALDTLELNPQAQIFASPGALRLPPGTTSIVVSITPVEPQGQPTDGSIDGNVYRFTIVNQAGAVVTADPSAKVTVELRVTDPATTTATMERFANGVWTPLVTQPLGVGAQFLAVVTEFGDFALVLPGAPASGGSTSTAPSIETSGPAASPEPSANGSGGGGGVPTVTIFAGIAIGVVLLGLLATALFPRRGRRGGRGGRGGRRGEKDGWSTKPPPRTRR